VNYVTGRAEVVDKDELFPDHDSFRVKALTLGYSRDLVDTRVFTGALGTNVTLYSIPRALESAYGSPHSLYVFMRLRLRGAATHDMHSM
jgi:hypothetical protein